MIWYRKVTLVQPIKNGCYCKVVRMASIVFVDPGKDVILDLWWIDFVHLFLLLPITLTSRINALWRWQRRWSFDDNENLLLSPSFLVQKLIGKMQFPGMFSANFGQDCVISRGIVRHSFGNQTHIFNVNFLWLRNIHSTGSVRTLKNKKSKHL